MTSDQIVSKARVAAHGEVFTAPREVNAMLDLVKNETERIDSRFLEPACGKGVFLAEVLRRKLAVAHHRHAKNPPEYERAAFLALATLYGIDILADNVADCRRELLGVFRDAFHASQKRAPSADCDRAVRFLLEKNIIWGDALTLKRVDAPEEPIVFSEWSFVDAVHVKRRDFAFSNLLDCSVDGLPLFSDQQEEVWLPKSVKEFPLVTYLAIHEAEGGGGARGARTAGQQEKEGLC